MNIEFDEQELWIAVIRQALQDATSLTLEPALVREARDWFTPTNDNFNEVCELAGKCPVRTSKGAMRLIAAHDTKAKRVRSFKPVTLYTFDGRSLSLKQWGEVTGIAHGLIRQRISIGWTLEQALNTPVHSKAQKPDGRSPKTITHDGQTRTLRQWAELRGLSYFILYKRIRDKWNIGLALNTPAKVYTARGVNADLGATLRDRRGSIAQTFPEIEFSKIEELAE